MFGGAGEASNIPTSLPLIQSRGNWFHLPLVAGALLVLGLLLFFARYKLKKQKLRKRQKRSDEVEALLQQMDEALWDEQENLCQSNWSSLVDPALSSKLGTLEIRWNHIRTLLDLLGLTFFKLRHKRVKGILWYSGMACGPHL